MTLTQHLRTLADTQPNGPVGPRQRGTVAGLIEDLFVDHAELRRKYLILRAFDVDSVKKLQPCQVRAFLAWLNPVRDSDGRVWPCADAAQDVRAFEAAIN